MINVCAYHFSVHAGPHGKLVALEGQGDIPFDIKRVYYIYDVDKEKRRGYHSHVDLCQMLICVSGSVKVQVKTPFEDETHELNDPCQGLYIGPMIWREMFDFSPGAVLLVLAGGRYDESDYIRDYEKYVSLATGYFRKGDAVE